MKECPQCGKVWEDNWSFCEQCGKSLATEEQSRPLARPIANPAPSTSPRSSRELNVLYAALVVALLVIVALVCVKVQEHLKADSDSVLAEHRPNGQETVSRPGEVVAANKEWVENFGSPRLKTEPDTPPTEVAPSRPEAPDTVTRRNPSSSNPSNTVTLTTGGLPDDSTVAPGIGALTQALTTSKLEQFCDKWDENEKGEGKLGLLKLCLLRNEYFVRKGYTFSNKTHPHLTKWFEAESWYRTRPNQSYDNDHPVPWDSFSANEKATILAIQGIERQRGSWHISHIGPQPSEEISGRELPAGEPQ